MAVDDYQASRGHGIQGLAAADVCQKGGTNPVEDADFFLGQDSIRSISQRRQREWACSSHNRLVRHLDSRHK
jgi:hypothetical protein